jgi:PPK2 family polyphosphate:nucleotide phosphotransferase
MKAQEYGPILRVPPGKRVSLQDYDPAYKGDFVKKSEAAEALADGVRELARLQDRLYAQDQYALLIILQAMDAAGKDGIIKHVMSGLNPQGTQVFSFKVPSAEEMDHDYMWRNFKALPERGRIGIHNRSYYEETLVVRVHPQILDGQRLPAHLKDKGIWKRRFREMNNFERYLVANGTIVLKFFLHVSKEEQKKRFLERIDLEEKNWKFSSGDVKERAYWQDYMRAYEDVLSYTSTNWAPWYVIPADRKWFTRLAVAGIIGETMRGLNLAYPTLSEEQKQDLTQAREMLMSEAT